ncbi:hypothetical protein BJF84_21675 [Rhodococcus sp. CUA-806]|nr:hypothetical protein BJF84_21675 [Rhodococcus sp. CUA-806]
MSDLLLVCSTPRLAASESKTSTRNSAIDVPPVGPRPERTSKMDEYDRPHVTIGHVGRSKPLGARWCGTGRTDKPLLVFLHGGGYDDRYFDIPGQSVIEQAAAAGYGAVSITRPGYPTDTASAADHPTFAQAAEILDDAISDAWNEFGGGPGVVLVTHSIGSAVGLHLAARDLGFPLLGVATSAISDTLAPAAAGVIASMPPHHPVELPFPPHAKSPVRAGLDRQRIDAGNGSPVPGRSAVG